MLYNDDYRPILGEKHPHALGQRGSACWPEIWHIIGPMLERVLGKGEATRAEDLLLLLESNGYPEERYFSFSYSPIHHEAGGIGGVFTPVKETTEKVIGERRLRTLRDLAARTREARDADAVCHVAAEIIAANPYDIPFAALYRVAADGQMARLTANAGMKAGTPTEIVLGDGGGIWPFHSVVRTGKPERLNDLPRVFGDMPTDVPTGAWSVRPISALVLPIALPGRERPAALLVAAVNPHKALDEDYRSFLDLVAAQIGSAMADALAYEHEHQRAEALTELDRAKTAFFANVSHEFRTPVTLMLGALEEVLRKPAGEVPPENRALVAVAHRSGLRLLKLVNTLLDFSRIEAGRVQASYEPTALAALTAELVSNFRSACEKSGLSLTVDCPALGEAVYVDHDMWEKIVLNLVSNAFKYTMEGGIEVRLRAVNGAAVLSVRDSGCGIPEHEIPRLFERFHRVAGARGRSHEGTGIGLALVHELARLHGGTVRVESIAGAGSTFTVAIPFGTAHLPSDRIRAEPALAATAIAAAAYVEEARGWMSDGRNGSMPEFGIERPLLPARHRAAGPISAEDGERPTILLADDNADMRDYVRRLLHPRYEVRAVPDGAAALAALAEEPRPALLLSDVMMPRLDGLGLLRAVRADPALADMPVVLLSARAGEEASIEGLEAGADDYLVKPFSARELLARVAANLEMAQLRTRHRTAEQAARAAEERLRVALAASGTGAYRWEIRANIAEADEALERLFGFSGSGGTTRTIEEFLARVHPDDRSDVKQRIGRCVDETADFDMEFRIVEPEGGVRWLYDRGKMFVDADGNPAYMAGACVDITERKRAEAALLVLNETLERKVEERTRALTDEMAERQKAEAALQQAQRLEVIGQVTGGVAHDFNNLLTIVGGSLELLKLDPSKSDRVIDNIERAIARGQGLTQQLLSFSRRQTRQRKVLDLSARTHKLVELLRPSLRGDIEMVTEIADDIWPVEIDPGELELALLNIAVNARDAMPKGGTLTLSIRNERLCDGSLGDGSLGDGSLGNLSGDFVRIAMTDTGTGMPRGLLTRIFEPFFTTKEEGKGTGLGLSQVLGFATQSGGTASVESTEGLGTTITIFLPRSTGSLLPPEIEAAVELPQRRSGTILLADDNDDVAAVTTAMLEGLGYTVARVRSSRRALEYLETHGCPDIVLTDIMMPGGANGIDLARALRTRYPGLPVVLTTGYGTAARAAADEGFVILTKPYRMSALERIVREASDRMQPGITG